VALTHLHLAVVKTRIGVRVKVQIPSRTDPRALETTGHLQLTAADYQVLETALKAGGKFCHPTLYVTASVPDLRPNPRGRAR
jgi:hypothetical protein